MLPIKYVKNRILKVWKHPRLPFQYNVKVSSSDSYNKLSNKERHSSYLYSLGLPSAAKSLEYWNLTIWAQSSFVKPNCLFKFPVWISKSLSNLSTSSNHLSDACILVIPLVSTPIALAISANLSGHTS